MAIVGAAREMKHSSSTFRVATRTALLGVFLVACGSGSDDAPVADAAVTLGACTWPAAFDHDGDAAAAGVCQAWRRYLACSTGSASISCVSDGSLMCAGTAGSEYTGCQDLCGANEYALACGVASPGSSSTPPPASCTVISQTAEGTFVACCTCGS